MSLMSIRRSAKKSVSTSNCSLPEEQRLTGSSFGTASDVDAGSVHVRVPSPSGQVSVEGHLEEVAGCVDAVIVQRELVAEKRDSVAGPFQSHFTGLATTPHVELAVHRAATLGVGGHELSHCTVASMRIFLKLNFRHDYVVFQNRPAIRADRVTSRLVHFDLG